MLIKSPADLQKHFTAADQVIAGPQRLNSILKSPKDIAAAFGPDELRIGSVVQGRLKRALGEQYSKDHDDVRPMLVTGLWRSGEDIKKIELMKFSSSDWHTPSDFLLDTTSITRNGRKYRSFLKTEVTYILDNSNFIFPFEDNKEEMKMNGDLWADIILRRAYAILYSEKVRTYASLNKAVLKLEREGFVLPNIPITSARSDSYIPEMHHEYSVYNEAVALPQDLIDTIVHFAGTYTERMHNQSERHFVFPTFDEWPMDIPEAKFPRWRPVGHVGPQLAQPVL